MKEKMFLVALSEPKVDPVFFGIFSTLENASEAIRTYVLTKCLTPAALNLMHDAPPAEVDEDFAQCHKDSGYQFHICKVAPDSYTLADVFAGERVNMLSAVECQTEDDDDEDGSEADYYATLIKDNLEPSGTSAGMSCLPFESDIPY